jgi:UDP-N-acetyl-D-glucosamine dehydrogenase
MKNFFFNQLQKKIKAKKVKIGIIGLGYVGLPLANAFTKNNIIVHGFDTDLSKITSLNKGKSFINYFKNKNIKEMIKKKFTCGNDFSKISEIDFIILCLPTPLTKNKKPDMSYIKKSLLAIKKYLRPGQALCLESTTYPGTCREVLAPVLKRFSIGEDFFLIYSPEREDPGNKEFSILKTPKIVGGFSKKCLNIGYDLYKLLNTKIIKVPTLEIAEFTKLLENIYRSVNIGMINELKILAQKMNINIFEVIKAAKTKPFGFHAFYPGPGYGGHCIPIDPFLLSWKANQYNFDTKFIKLSGKINENMPLRILNKIKKIIKENIIKKKVLILGVAYKKNVDDTRESPAIHVMKLLTKNKIKYDFLDPFVPELKGLRNFNLQIKSIELKYSLLKQYPLIILITDHDKFNYKAINKNSQMILDCRGRYAFNISEKIIQI